MYTSIITRFMVCSKLSLKSKSHITQKLVAFEGEPKPSKINSMMKWWSRCISVAIAKTASRNVAFKVAKMREAIMEDQDEFLKCVMRSTQT